MGYLRSSFDVIDCSELIYREKWMASFEIERPECNGQTIDSVHGIGVN